MLFDLIVLPSEAIFPLGIAVTYIALVLYVLSSRKPDGAMDSLFITYLLSTILWDINLVAAVNDVPIPLAGLTWQQFMPYGLIILGVIYWAFARAFLQRPWKALWGWVTGLAGLVLAVNLDMPWFVLPPSAFAWSNGWVHAQNIAFMLSVGWWVFFMILAAWMAIRQQFQTQSPAHKNRIQYLLISTISLTIGYGLYLSLREPFWAAGLIVTGLGGVLATYTVTVEDLIDLGIGARRVIRWLVVALITVCVYVAGIYLVQILLGDLLATFSGFVDHTLLVASVTAVLLTIVYTPIQQISQRVTDRLLFGQRYNYQMVIQRYTQAISNRLYLDELAGVAMKHINEALQVQRSALFILDSVSSVQIHLRTLPTIGTNGIPERFSLKKDTPITHRLITEGQALAQYKVDISAQFKSVSEDERQTLKSLNYEWFVPIRKEGQLVGIFALGAKKSGRSYTAQDMRLLDTLADQTALALENATLFDRVQRNLAEITEMKNLMDSVFDSMDDGVITTDIDGRITFYNRAAQSILMVSADNSIGTPYAEVLPSLAQTIFPNLVKNVTRREDHYSDYEIISDLPGRGRVNLSMSLTPLKDAENQTQGVAIVVDDLTETKRLQAVQDMFRRYVSPAVVDRLPEDPADLQLGGHRQEVTILFADIRGFTAFSENLEPEALVDTLNQYLSMAAASILMYEGTLDKFMGDAVMGIFNAPLEQEDHALRAVRAAVAMQRAIADYAYTNHQGNPLSFGVGLHIGEAVVGNVGMFDRMDYTAIGDTVNLAKRIQENSPGGAVLMSEAVYQEVKDSVKTIFYKEMKVKGREQPVNTYKLEVV